MHYRTLDAFIIFCGGLFFFTWGLSAQEIINFETRFYLFALEMWRHGITWFPTTYQQPYPDYPATSTLLIYGSAKLFGGLNKLTAVLPSAIAAAMTLAVTYLTGALHLRRWGWYAAGFLLFTLAFFSQARTISLDMFVAALTAGSFYLAYSAELQQKKPSLVLIMLLLAASFAIRGPIGLIIPTAVLCVFYAVTKQIRYAFYIGCLAAFVLLFCCLILFAIAYYAGGMGLLQDVLRMQIWGRLQGQAPPIYFYWLDGAAGYAITYPLAILLLLGIAPQLFRSHVPPEMKFMQILTAWVLIILLGLSVPADKKIRYVLAIAPALALLCGYLFAVPPENSYLRRLRSVFYIFCLVFPALMMGVLWVLWQKKVSLNYSFCFAVFAAIQSIVLLSEYRYKMGFLGGVLTFLCAAVFVFEPLNLQANHTGNFVMQVEKMRAEQQAKLVFYREGRDSLPIKYVIHMSLEELPLFISNSDELPRDAFIILKEKQLPNIPLQILARGNIGHDEVLVAMRTNKTASHQAAVS